MLKADFIEAVAKKAGVSKKDADAVVKAVTEVITDVVKKEDSIMLPGLGTFTAVKKNERTSRNPRTGETLKVPAHNAPKFKAAKALKDAADSKK